MLDLILQNFEMVSWFLIVLAGAVLAEITSATYASVFKLHEGFDWKFFLCGFVKGVIFMSSFYFFAATVTMIPILLEQYNIIAENVADVVNILLAISILLTATIQKLRKVIENWNIIFNTSSQDLVQLKYERAHEEEYLDVSEYK